MKVSIPRSSGLAAAGFSKDTPSTTRGRVLEVACELFAKMGFHGTHLREICKFAGTNVAGVCYHFHSKEGLYQAVVMEAGRRLAYCDDGAAASPHLSPPERITKLIESLLKQLATEEAWIAKLLTRELVNPACGSRHHAVSGLERSYILLQSALRELHGADTNDETIRLQALSLIGECLLFSLASENLDHPLIQLAGPLPNRAHLAQLITGHSLSSYHTDGAKPEVSEL